VQTLRLFVVFPSNCKAFSCDNGVTLFAEKLGFKKIPL